jgi:hypothetical protein
MTSTGAQALKGGERGAGARGLIMGKGECEKTRWRHLGSNYGGG